MRKLPPGQKASEKVAYVITPAQMDRLERLARRESRRLGMSISPHGYARMVLLRSMDAEDD